MDAVARALKDAQNQAESLFAAIVSENLIVPGKLESVLSRDIHKLARAHFGVRRHWHKRVVRSGPNTLLKFSDTSVDRRIAADDIVSLDLGPVFDVWEADLGRTYVLGPDPDKQRLVTDIADAFRRGRALFDATPELTAGELYDFVFGLAPTYGWKFGASSAGHLIGAFPHESLAQKSKRFTIRHGNATALRERDRRGRERHWILEIHFVDEAKQIGGFFEELLTIGE